MADMREPRNSRGRILPVFLAVFVVFMIVILFKSDSPSTFLNWATSLLIVLALSLVVFVLAEIAVVITLLLLSAIIRHFVEWRRSVAERQRPTHHPQPQARRRRYRN